jgi:hypothetical protein
VLSGAVFQIEDYNVSTNPIAATIIPASPNLGLGGRGSAKVTVLWTDHFSSYLKVIPAVLRGRRPWWRSLPCKRLASRPGCATLGKLASISDLNPPAGLIPAGGFIGERGETGAQRPR